MKSVFPLTGWKGGAGRTTVPMSSWQNPMGFAKLGFPMGAGQMALWASLQACRPNTDRRDPANQVIPIPMCLRMARLKTWERRVARLELWDGGMARAKQPKKVMVDRTQGKSVLSGARSF